MRLAALALLTLALAAHGFAGGGKPKKPQLDLRAVPRFAFSPANVLFTAELVGGDDVEELHCPEVEWDWGDGGKSVSEGDCPPFEAGQAIERRFTAEHEFKRAGNYSVKVTLRRARRSIAAQTVRVTVRPGLGDRTIE
jgi:hypothetical protein